MGSTQDETLCRGAVLLLMVYSGSPVKTSVGHGLHQQRCFDTVLSFPVGSRMPWRRFNF